MKKYINDKNYFGFINDLPEGDKRIPHLLKQRKEQGFDYTETWNLYGTIASFSLPRLKEFRRQLAGVPMGLTKEEWIKILDDIVAAFELIHADNFHDKKNIKIVDRGLNLFKKWFFSLWW